MAKSILTTKGRTTVPPEIRNALCVKPGSKLSWTLNPEGTVSVRAATRKKVHDPLHPGAFIQEVYLKPNGMSRKDLAAQMNIAESTLRRLLNEVSGVSPRTAIRLSKVLGRSPESWMAMQRNYDQAK